MKVHYFQRYYEKENVATANTMLLLSRLYSFSPDKFFKTISSLCEDEHTSFEIEFKMQESYGKKSKTIPDAVIKQEGFKIIIETKITDWFYSKQLEGHLDHFEEGKTNYLISISSELMKEKKKEEIDQKLSEKLNGKDVKHINTTFKLLAEQIEAVLDRHDHEMLDILNDYLEYCSTDGLIDGKDAWKYMRMQLAGSTLDFNVKNNMYYCNAEKRFSPFGYLALYKNKSVRSIGKVICTATAIKNKTGDIDFEIEKGELTEERKRLIIAAMQDAKTKGWNTETIKHRYFFVDSFYETDFKKTSKGGCIGSKIFDITEYLQIKSEKNAPTAEQLASLLNGKEWN